MTVWLDPCEQILVRKLLRTFTKPFHDGSNRLSRLAPLRPPQACDLQLWLFLVQSNVTLNKGRRGKDVIPNQLRQTGA